MEGKEFLGTEKIDTYYGTWNGIKDWDTYTGDEE